MVYNCILENFNEKYNDRLDVDGEDKKSTTIAASNEGYSDYIVYTVWLYGHWPG